MNGYNLLDGKCIEVEVADYCVKYIDMNAKYMVQVDSYTLMLIPTYETEIPYEFQYSYYTIDGKLYRTCYTNKLEQLRKHYGSKVKNEQLNLFDF